MRRTVSREMRGTTPSVTNCRAISRQSQKDKERPRSSGRSQAILTRCSATEGGKDRRAAGPRLVVEASQPLASKPLGPLAGVPHAQATPLGGVLQGHSLFQQQQDATPAGQSGGAGGRPLPTLDFCTVRRREDDGQGGFAATHGVTEDARFKETETPSDLKDRQDRVPLSIQNPFSAALY
jgi:hypothetical protein